MDYRLHLEAERLARRYEELVAPVWDRPLCGLLETHLETSNLPSVLAAECRTGWVCEFLQQKYPQSRVMAVDASREMLDVARTRLHEQEGTQIFFGCQQPNELSYATGVFGSAVCLGAPRSQRAFDNVVAELNRVLDGDGWLALAVPLVDSAQAFTDLLREALWATDLGGLVAGVDHYLSELVDSTTVANSLTTRGATIVQQGVYTLPLVCESADNVLFDAVIQQLFLHDWLDLIPAPEPRKSVLADVLRRFGSYFDGLDLTLNVHVHWVVARTAGERYFEVYEAEDFDIEEIADEGPPEPPPAKVEPSDEGVEPESTGDVAVEPEVSGMFDPAVDEGPDDADAGEDDEDLFDPMAADKPTSES